MGPKHKKHLIGPLSYDNFRHVNSLQLHAPFDQKERDLAGLRSYECHGENHREEKLASRLRQFLNVLVGVSVGLTAALIRYALEALGKWRRGWIIHLLEQSGDSSFGVWRAFAAAVCLTAVPALLATCAVVWCPASAGSGIPGVLAFLNGVDLRGALGGRVLVAKTLGTVLAVGGGMAVGPEGPMVHVGAIVGMLVVRRCVAPALRRMGPMCRRLEDELSRQPLRYHIQAAVMGSGAGIAAAFSAPLAGTVFVVEEAASFFSKRLLLHSFITCACAVLTANLVEGLLGLTTKSIYLRTAGGCPTSFTWSPILALQVCVTGVLCGLLAILFNRIVVGISSKFAIEATRLGSGWPLWRRRFAFTALVSTLCGVFAVSMAVATQCQDASLQNAFHGSSGCILEEWLTQLVSGGMSVDSNNNNNNHNNNNKNNKTTVPKALLSDGPKSMAYLPVPGLFGAQYNPTLCPAAISRNAGCRLDGIELMLSKYPGIKDVLPEHYCCGFESMADLEQGNVYNQSHPKAPLMMGDERWPRGSCPLPAVDPDNKVAIGSYSPGAALTLVSPTDVVRNLLTRGTPGILSWQVVAIYLVGYFILAACSATAWVPGGLLVPMIAIGAASGRLIGLAWRHAINAIAGTTGSSQYNIPWIPQLLPMLDFLDSSAASPANLQSVLHTEPGILALAGCAAFLSGSGSLVMFVLVLLIEVTLDPFLIPVILISVLAARTTTSLLGTHGLYHELMHVQSLPFLPESGHWRQGHYVVDDLLKEDERRLRMLRAVQPEEVQSQWRRGGSPENQDVALTPPPLVTLSKTATRAEVSAVLERCLPGDAKPMLNGFPVIEPGEGMLCGLVTRDALLTLLAQSSVPHTRSWHFLSTNAAASAGYPPENAPAGIERVMDTAPFVVQAETPVLHAHMLFSRCGIRHLVVVNSANKPIGVLTRKSLMPWRTPWLSTNSLHHDTFLEQREAHSPIPSRRGSGTHTPQDTPPSRRGSGFPTPASKSSARRTRTLEQQQQHRMLEEVQGSSMSLDTFDAL